MEAYIKKISSEAKCPKYSHPGEDAGADVYSCENVTIMPGKRCLVSTGIAIKPPTGTYTRIAPKSGLSCRGIDIGAGVVDSGYRNVIKVLMINNSDEAFTVKKKMKIAQIIFERIVCANMIECSSLPDSSRGTGGFGSTGSY